MAAYGTFSERVKERAKKFVGIDDDAPRSVSVKEYFQENKQDVPKAVSWQPSYLPSPDLPSATQGSIH